MINFKNNLTIKELNSYLLLSLSFFITISIYITDVIVLLLFLSWLLSGNFKNKLIVIFQNPLTYAIICFFTYFLISYFWSDSSVWNTITKKQLLLLLLPILYTLRFDSKYIEKSKYAFIIGLVVNIILSIITLIFPENIFFKKGHYDTSIFLHGFLDHFDYSIFLCFGIFLLLSFSNKKRRGKYWVLIMLFLCALLNSYGRIGILSFCIFLPIIIILFKHDVANYYLIIFLLFIYFSYSFFEPFTNRINQTINNVQLLYTDISFEDKVENDAVYMASKDSTTSKDYFIKQIMKKEEWIQAIKNKSPKYETSVGQRYLYAKNSLSLIRENPLFGHGAHQFEKIYSETFDTNNPVKHPHNNFIFILVELGLLGLGFALYIFYCLIKRFFTANRFQFLKLIFPLYFLWIMLFDNYFLNHNTLVFFCLFGFLIYEHEIDVLDIDSSNSSR